jgi:hypothetical protein
MVAKWILMVGVVLVVVAHRRLVALVQLALVVRVARDRQRVLQAVRSPTRAAVAAVQQRVALVVLAVVVLVVVVAQVRQAAQILVAAAVVEGRLVLAQTAEQA